MNATNKVLLFMFLVLTSVVLLAANAQDDGRTFFTVKGFSTNTDNATFNDYATGNISINVTDGIYVSDSTYFPDMAYFQYSLSAGWIEDNIDGGMIDAPGNDTEIIFNDGDVLGADSDFTWNKVTSVLTMSDGGASIAIDGANDTITATSGTLGFGDENLTTTGTITATGANFDYINFDLVAAPPYQEGRISWNDNDKTLDIHTEVAATRIQVGQEIVVRTTNKTGGALLNGTVVYVDGAQGSRPTIVKADASVASTADGTLGVVTSDIADNATGYVTCFGLVRDVDTSGEVAGDMIYLSETAGEWTETAPVAPAHRVLLGFVLFSNATTGVIFVRVDIGNKTTQLHDVDETAATADGEVLVWDNANSKFIIGDRGDIAGTIPAGADTQVQTNNGGVLGADAGFVYDVGSSQVKIGDPAATEITINLVVDESISASKSVYVGDILHLGYSAISGDYTFAPLRQYDDDGNYVGFVAQAMAVDYVVTWPAVAGTAGQILNAAAAGAGATTLGWTTDADALVGVDVGATPDFLGAAFNDGAFRATLTDGITYTDGGDFITLGLDIVYADVTANDGGTDVSAAELEELSDGSQTTLHGHANNKAVTIEVPAADEDITLWFTDYALTIVQLAGVVRGSLSPGVIYTIRHHTDRADIGNEVITGGSSIASTTTGDIEEAFDDETIPENSWIWLETTTESGTTVEMAVTMSYTID